MLEHLQTFADQFDGYTELRLQNNYTTRQLMRKGSLIQNSASKTGGVSARCYNGGAFGFASMPDPTDENVKAVIAQANANADLFQRKARRTDAPLPGTAAGTGRYDYRTAKSRFGAAHRMEVLRAIDAHVSEQYPDLLNADIILGSLAMEKALVTSEGAATYSYIPRAVLMVQLSYQAGDDIVDIYDSYGGFGDMEEHFESLEWLFPQLDDLYAKLRKKADGVYCRAGLHDVILDPDVAGILAHEAIGHTCEADLVLAGSVAADNVGQQVAADKFTLVDYAERGFDGKGSIAIHVDDEGTPCRDVTIIEDGVLRNFLHNKETARIMGEEPTGNGRAYQFSDEPLVRMRNTAIVPGTDKLEEMIAAVDDGYYLARPTNGQADSTSEFMFGVGFGYEIKNGKLGRAIRDTTIAGVAFDMLQTITHVSDDMEWSVGGMCGKKQLIPVGMGGPAIKCKITIGGR